MFEIEFYKDSDGNEPVAEYIRSLNKKALTNKYDRIQYKKIVEYLEVLSKVWCTCWRTVRKAY